MKGLHVTEIRDLVLCHLKKVPDQSLKDRFSQQISCCSGTGINTSKILKEFEFNKEVPQKSQQDASRVIEKANISTAIYTDKKARFKLKPKFLKVVRSVPGTNQAKTVFTYEEVTSLLSKYILSRKEEIFDPRNIKLESLQLLHKRVSSKADFCLPK